MGGLFMPLMEVEKGIEIYYEEYGSGDRYLICSQQSHAQHSLEKELVRYGFHVFLLTNRGFGRSTHLKEDYGDYWYDRFADDVVHFADKMGIDRFVYSGASHGAGCGWSVVKNYPERVICFFAVVPGPHSLDEGKMSFKEMVEKGLIVLKESGSQTDDPSLLERRKLAKEEMERVFQSDEYKKYYETDEVRNIHYGRPLANLENEENLKAVLRTIQTPVLILGGGDDPISRNDLMVRTMENLPNCKLVIYGGFPHGIDIYEELAFEANRFYNNIAKTGYYWEPVIND